MSIKSYNDTYEIHAWQNNNRTFKVTTGEGGAKCLRFRLKDNQGYVSLVNNPIISYVVTKSNGRVSSTPASILDADKGEIEISIEPSLTDVAGTATGEIRVVDDEDILKFYGISLCVLKGVSDDKVVESSEFSDLIKALIKVVALSTSGVATMDKAVTESSLNPVAGKIIHQYLIDNYIPLIRKIAGFDLSKDITVEQLQTALKAYPFKTFSKAPTTSDMGKVGQLGGLITYSTTSKSYSVDLYLCCSVDSSNGIYQWVLINSNAISDTQISSALAEYLEKHPIDGVGADGADGIGVDKAVINSNGELVITYTDGSESNVGKVVGANGKDGVDGQDGIDGENGKDGYSPTISVASTDTGYKLTITNAENHIENVLIKHGENGQDGDTPVRGTDYYTEEDKAEIKADNIAYISTELAKRGQLKPEFASSIEECTDTTKLYVLPDGFIYAFMTVENVGGTEEVTEQITGEFTEDYRLSTSSGSLSALSGAIATPLIDITGYGEKFTIHLRSANGGSANSVQWANANQDTTGNSICLYKNDTFALGGFTGRTKLNGIIYAVNSADDVDITFDKSAVPASAQGFTHVRFSGVTGRADRVAVSVTYEKETQGGTETKWANTGHAFVPADYEQEIVDIRNDVENLKRTATNTNGVPDYVLEEAQKVADKVITLRNAHSFVFGAFSDTHTTGEDTSKDSIVHAGMGLDEVNNITQLDLVLNFGDVMVGYLDDTYKEGFKHVKSAFNSVAKAVPYIQMQGNHDQISSDTTAQAQQKYFAYIGSNNVNTVTDWDNRFRNYGYRDFEDQKLRVIYLNTADVSEADNTKDVWITAQQCSWLINTALDFSDKEHAQSWGFIVCSHHPLNWYYLDNLLAILNAYKGKASGSITQDSATISYDFTNAKAELIAHFHGHLHNFRAEQLGSNGVTTVTIPNACFDRNNEYGYHSDAEVRTLYGDTDDSGIQRKFSKTSGTADDTAFNVVVIDRDNRKINCINYGAGFDREIGY